LVANCALETASVKPAAKQRRYRELIQSISMDHAAAGKQQLGNFAIWLEALLSYQRRFCALLVT
jgi:hypothetical protein